MTKAEELKNVILGQIKLLGDDSVIDDGEWFDRLIRRSDVMSELSKSWIEIQQTKVEEKRLRIESVRNYLGIEYKGTAVLREHVGGEKGSHARDAKEVF